MRATAQEPDTGNRRELRDATYFDLPLTDGCEFAESATAARDTLVERVADIDDDVIAELFLEGEHVNGEALIAACTRVCRDESAVPLLCGSSLHGMGVEAPNGRLCSFPSTP